MPYSLGQLLSQNIAYCMHDKIIKKKVHGKNVLFLRKIICLSVKYLYILELEKCDRLLVTYSIIEHG